MTLEDFAKEWLRNGPLRPPPLPYEKAGATTGVTLYRDGKFQVQFWICPPNTDIGDHCHPNIDSYAVRVAGDIKFRKHGRPVGMRDIQIVVWNGMRTSMIHFGTQDLHGGAVGDAGGSFLVITERLDGAGPVSAHLDWAGPPLDADHAKQLERVA